MQRRGMKNKGMVTMYRLAVWVARSWKTSGCLGEVNGKGRRGIKTLHDDDLESVHSNNIVTARAMRGSCAIVIVVSVILTCVAVGVSVAVCMSDRASPAVENIHWFVDIVFAQRTIQIVTKKKENGISTLQHRSLAKLNQAKLNQTHLDPKRTALPALVSSQPLIDTLKMKMMLTG